MKVDINSQVSDISKLTSLLEGYGVPVYKWGKSGHKSVNKLFDDVQEGIVNLLVDGDKLYREIHSVVLNIFFELETNNTPLRLKLREVMEVFKDKNGKIDSSTIIKQQAKGSLAKKYTIGKETPEKAAVNVLKKELNLTKNTGFINKREYQATTESFTFPGLQTIYNIVEFDLYFTSIEFRPEGYCEENDDKITVFEWIIV